MKNTNYRHLFLKFRCKVISQKENCWDLDYSNPIYLVSIKYVISMLLFSNHIPVQNHIFVLHGSEKHCIATNLILCLLLKIQKSGMNFDIQHIYAIKISKHSFNFIMVSVSPIS